MTFQRSLYFSFAAHVLVFGCAIAIANYGHGTLSPHSRVIEVTIVSSDPGSGKEPGIESRSQYREPVSSHDPEPPARPLREQPVSSQTPEPVVEGQNNMHEYTPVDPGSFSLSATEQNGTAEHSTGQTEGGGQITAKAVPGIGIESGFGLIAPEQWSLIVSAIERTKNYPRLARERGIEGVVRLRFKINAEGGVDKIEIIESSGSQILDNASIRAVYRAAPMPAVSGWIEMPIKYVLK